MVASSVAMGICATLGLAVLGYWFFDRLTMQVQEQSESFLLSFGKLEKRLSRPGLHWTPSRLLPWVSCISVSKQIDYRTYRGIQVNDRYGTTVVVDLWLEFRISEPYRALFSVENWEEVLQSVVVHSTASILCSQTVEEILKHRTELAEQLQASIALETERWGITLTGAMIQNIGLLPEISKQFFQSVAARIERTTALVREEGRLQVAKLDATTAHKVAELNGLARSQMPMEIGKFYQTLSTDPVLLEKFKAYWELNNLDPRKTVTFNGFTESPIGAVEATKAIESMMSH
jgi:regulator of protease activity HflC (stomatin/prohibitin superfamily)